MDVAFLQHTLLEACVNLRDLVILVLNKLRCAWVDTCEDMNAEKNIHEFCLNLRFMSYISPKEKTAYHIMSHIYASCVNIHQHLGTQLDIERMKVMIPADS